MTEVKKGFGKINLARTHNRIQGDKAREQKQVLVKKTRPQGRPTTKNPDMEYVRVTCTIPEHVRDELKVALYTKFRGVHKTQDDFLAAAIQHYIKCNH